MGEIQGLYLRVKLVPKAHDFQPKKGKEGANEEKRDEGVGNPGIRCAKE
jgi:hypothetical protein